MPTIYFFQLETKKKLDKSNGRGLPQITTKPADESQTSTDDYRPVTYESQTTTDQSQTTTDESQKSHRRL